MTQYRLLVKQGIAGIAAALHNGSSELIGKYRAYPVVTHTHYI